MSDKGIAPIAPDTRRGARSDSPGRSRPSRRRRTMPLEASSHAPPPPAARAAKQRVGRLAIVRELVAARPPLRLREQQRRLVGTRRLPITGRLRDGRVAAGSEVERGDRPGSSPARPTEQRRERQPRHPFGRESDSSGRLLAQRDRAISKRLGDSRSSGIAVVGGFRRRECWNRSGTAVSGRPDRRASAFAPRVSGSRSGRSATRGPRPGDRATVSCTARR